MIPLSVPDQPEPSDRELILTLIAANAALTERVSELEARVPKPRFQIPQGWIGVREAVARCRVSKATLYRRLNKAVKKGAMLGVLYRGRRYFDPADLPRDT